MLILRLLLQPLMIMTLEMPVKLTMELLLQIIPFLLMMGILQLMLGQRPIVSSASFMLKWMCPARAFGLLPLWLNCSVPPNILSGSTILCQSGS